MRVTDDRVTRVSGGAQAELPGVYGHVGPDVRAVLLLHRGPDGYAVLARQHAGAWQELGGLPLDNPQAFAAAVPYLRTDAFVSINTMYRRRGARYVESLSNAVKWQTFKGRRRGDVEIARERPPMIRVQDAASELTGLPFISHARDSLRWLNGCFVDLDCYKSGLDYADTIAHVYRLQDARTIPPASIIMRSGRGVWLFWLLRDARNPATGEVRLHGARHRADTPARAWTEQVSTYVRLNRLLAERLAHLGADPNATDACRVSRVVGSVNSKADGAAVRAWVQYSDDGRSFLYTLRELAHAIGFDPAVSSAPLIAEARGHLPANQSDAQRLRNRKGWRARHAYMLSDLVNLIDHRGGGFPDGCRNAGAFFYAIALLRNGMDVGEVRHRIRRYAARCRPPLSVRDADKQSQSAIDLVRKRSHARLYPPNAVLAHTLKVDGFEASLLRVLKPAGHGPDVPRERLSAIGVSRGPLTTGLRRAALSEVVAAKLGGITPSVRTMQSILQDRGFNCSHMTVANDYAALGLHSTQKGGRPKPSTLF